MEFLAQVAFAGRCPTLRRRSSPSPWPVSTFPCHPPSWPRPSVDTFCRTQQLYCILLRFAAFYCGKGSSESGPRAMTTVINSCCPWRCSGQTLALSFGGPVQGSIINGIACVRSASRTCQCLRGQTWLDHEGTRSFWMGRAYGPMASKEFVGLLPTPAD